MKYRDNMTETELRAFMRDVDALHQAYANAAVHDAVNAQPMPDEWEDATEILRRAALSRGQP